jgi:hypothetical protein
MNVGKSIRKAIDEYAAGDLDSAMLHACNAIDGTAGKRYKGLGNKARFTRLLRDSYGILGPMGAPGFDLDKSRFDVKTKATGDKIVEMDIADVIYAVHRCHHGHGDELPEGFELNRDASGMWPRTRTSFSPGAVGLSDRIIFGLLAVAVLASENIDQNVPNGYFLTLGNTPRMMINQWWGRSADFAAIVASQPEPQVNVPSDWIKLT